MTIEELFNLNKRFYPKNNYIKEMITSFLSNENINIEEINDYYILHLDKEYFVTKKNKEVYKSFLNKEDAVNYCLDKINTESKQINLF